MKISVVIPLYNKENQIENSLNHVLNQSFRDFEIIIIDDGSTDSSLEKVKAYSNPEIRVFTQENHGASYTRNRGAELAASDLIAFLDADDEWADDYLECLYNLYERFPDAVAYGSNYYINENGKSYVLDFPGIEQKVGLIENYFVSGRSYTPLWTSAIMIKKAAFLQAKGFPTGVKLCEDIDLWCRLACLGRIAYLNEPHATYFRNSQDSLSRATDSNMFFPFLRDYVNYRDMVDEAFFSSIEDYVEHRKMMAASYALMIAKNPKQAREILKSINPALVSRKKYFGYKMLAQMPTGMLRIFVNMRLKRKGL